jgi:POT family proton-dependent oligopeptide transporter
VSSSLLANNHQQGQPAGIWVLFIAEMWERFSYYGMRVLLVLYLVASTGPEGGGFGWSDSSAYLLYGIYTWAVYLTPIFGGLLADRLLGTHRSLLIGGSIIIAGHLTLAATEFFVIPAGTSVTLDTAPGALICFVAGLTLVVIGTGFFKPCAAVMVGQLYEEGDSRRDAGFTIYYLGINVGALLAPLVAGTLGETLGWHWGFGAAAVGMMFGLVAYQILRPKYLHNIGIAPGHSDLATPLAADVPELSGVPPTPTPTPLTQNERQRIGAILILACIGNIMFWAVFEQMGSSLNMFAANSTDRTLWGLLQTPFPATWFFALSPISVLLFAPLFAALWPWLSARNRDPSTPVKFTLGLWLAGIAFIFMVFGAIEARDGALAGPQWLFMTFLFITWGEICVMPIGLSMVTKLAPPRLQSLMMGLWYFSYSLANLLGGLLAAFSVKLTAGEYTFFIDGLPGFFLALSLAPIVAGFAVLALTPMLRRWMHGTH